jgi:hypothetical protein
MRIVIARSECEVRAATADELDHQLAGYLHTAVDQEGA